MNDALAALDTARLELIAALLDRTKSRHAPRIADHDDRLIRDHETWLDMSVALRLMRHPEEEA